MDDFLREFPRRMKCVGLYSALVVNSQQKRIWKECGFEGLAEQMNMLYAVLLYIMEQSLRRESCTLKMVAAYIDRLNYQYLQKPMDESGAYALADIILNEILGNDGRPITFAAYDFTKEGQLLSLSFSYISNKIVYEGQARRVSYELTNEGYNLLLGTLELENNMKLTIQELIFQLHLEKQSYDKALEDIKQVFQLLQIQLQHLQEAMLKIKRNALAYSAEEYAELQGETIASVAESEHKFIKYREEVQQRIKDLRAGKLKREALATEAEAQVGYLKEIEGYLNRALGEQQQLMLAGYRLQAVYDEELNKLAAISLIERFDFDNKVFEPVLGNVKLLTKLDKFLHPLFLQRPEKIFNLAKVFEGQSVLKEQPKENAIEIDDFNQEEWEKAQTEARLARRNLYKDSLRLLLDLWLTREKITLGQIQQQVQALSLQQQLVPEVAIFKEIIIELLKLGTIDLAALEAASQELLLEPSETFQLQEMLLELLQEHQEWPRPQALFVERLEAKPPVSFKNVADGKGGLQQINCSDLLFSLKKRG